MVILKKSKQRKISLMGISNLVNPELANILMELGIIEQSGKGIVERVGSYKTGHWKIKE